MIIQLDRILFDHASGAAQTDALSIRIDRATPAPAWNRGAAQTSYAAYALVPTVNQQISIQADFSFPQAPSGSVRVRARAVDQSDMVLGNVVEAPIPPQGGQVAFNLADVQMWDRGTGRYDVSWQWQFQIGGAGPWIDFVRTDHVVFVTLDVPGAPWTQGSSHRRLWPWVRVLTWACAWGAGVKLTSTGLAGAAKKVARQLEAGLYEQGLRQSVPLEYLIDTTDYTEDFPDSVFFLTAFLDLLDGNPEPGKTAQVNCSDCASALATFANALGCDVQQKWISHKDGNTLRTNRVVLIGESGTGPETHWFSHHEFVARQRASDNALLIHDACLKVDADEDPTRGNEDHLFDLADGMELGALLKHPAEVRYVHRLFEPEQWTAWVVDDFTFRCLDDCVGQARAVSARIQERHDRIRADVDRSIPLGGAVVPPIINPPVLPGFTLYDRIENPRQWSTLGPLVTRSADFFYVGTGESGRGKDRRLRLSVAYSDSAAKARDAIAWMLAQTPARVSLEVRSGDLAVAALRNSGLYLIRDNAVIRVHNVGRHHVQLSSLVPVLDRNMERRVQNRVAVSTKRRKDLVRGRRGLASRPPHQQHERQQQQKDHAEQSEKIHKRDHRRVALESAKNRSIGALRRRDRVGT